MNGFLIFCHFRFRYKCSHLIKSLLTGSKIKMGLGWICLFTWRIQQQQNTRKCKDKKALNAAHNRTVKGEVQQARILITVLSKEKKRKEKKYKEKERKGKERKGKERKGKEKCYKYMYGSPPTHQTFSISFRVYLVR